tara:strand:- start:778 stop:1344 length:567 start_codon:yes stop_codon:yes gene_type:complete
MKIYKAIVNWKVMTLMLILATILFLVAFGHIGQYFEGDIDYIKSEKLEDLSGVSHQAGPIQGDSLSTSSGEEVVDKDRSALNVVTSTDQIKQYISLKALTYGVPQDIALKIAFCESNYRNICNQKYGCRGGIGIYQIVQSTFDEQCEGDPHDIRDNIECGVKMMSKSYYHKWLPSQHCWASTYGGDGQ